MKKIFYFFCLVMLGAQLRAQTATISFLSNDTTVSETAGSATIYLRLSVTSSASSAVNVTVSALSNAGPSDYTMAVSTITFAANAPVNTTAPVVITFNNDLTLESTEYLVLRLAAVDNATVGNISQFTFYIKDDDKQVPQPSNAIALNLLASFSNSVSGQNSAEIVVHDPLTQRLYIANSIGGKLDIVDFVNPSAPSLLYSIPITSYGNLNSVAVKNGTVALAIENLNPQDSGKVVFMNQNGVYINSVTVGMMPDMITFNTAGNKVITANEGEPEATYTNDPDGSVSIIDLSGGVNNLNQNSVSHITFTVYNGQENTLRSQGIRLYGLNASASKDLEPEYVTVAKDDSRAWVSLQENNALLEINLSNNSITSLRALGTKDQSLLNNGFDASNVTRGVNISTFPVKGFYLPDAIASYTVGGVHYVVSANEGDARAYNGFTEESRVNQLTLDPVKFPNGSELKNNYVLGRLNVTDKHGDIDNDGDIDTIYSYGSRSFSIWNASTGNLVYDSKDDLETITAANSFSVMFNASNTSATRKDRSDDKGPEPEGVTIGNINGATYAFIALERIGGVMVYDISNPNAPVYVTYVNNRFVPANGPDRGAEGIIFIPQSESPNGQHLVVAANEISSSLSIWGIAGCSTPLSSSLSVSNISPTLCSANPPVLSVPADANVSYQWIRNGALLQGATSNTYAPVLSGSYSVAITGGSNCATSSVVRTLTINPTPTLSIAGPQAICAGQLAVLSASGAGSYLWNTGFSGPQPTVTPNNTTTYTVNGTLAGCSSSAVVTLSVNPVPVLSITGPTAAVCALSAITLSASGANSYTWNTSATTSSIQVNPAISSVYLVSGTDGNGCFGFTSKTISVNPLPSVIISGAPVSVCEGAVMTLSATGAGTYSWSNGGNNAVLSYTALFNTALSVTGTDNNGCSATASVNTIVYARPNVSISGLPGQVCAGEPVFANASGALNYIWSTGEYGQQIQVPAAVTTTIYVTGSSAQNCTATAMAVLNVNACTGLEEQTSAAVVVYPNPASDDFRIRLSNTLPAHIQLLNNTGQVVYSNIHYTSETVIPVHELARGLYLLRIAGSPVTHQIILK